MPAPTATRPAQQTPLGAAEFYVVVPFYNEKHGLPATLEALSNQSDPDFSIVLVDNASTDDGARVACEFAASRPDVTVIAEPQKGTGAAADTGFRHAIAQGAAWIARTDADCLPDGHWVRNIKRAIQVDGLEFIAGKIKPREDDISLTDRDRWVLPLLVTLAENFGKIHRRGPQFKYGYIMVAGNNLAISADLYVRAGGFPRSAIEHQHEDRALAESVRTLTTRGGVKRDVVVYNSIRRVRAYGYKNTLLWYWAHRFKPAVVDVR